MEEKYYNEGKDAEYRFVIANMFNNNYGIFDVCDVTGLPLKKINEYTSERDDALTLDEHRRLKYDMCYRDGYYKREKSIALKMLEDYDVKFISKVTGLSIDEINELKEN